MNPFWRIVTVGPVPEWSFKIGDWQNAKRQWNCDQRVIYNTTRCIDAGHWVIRRQGVSDRCDGARPLWRSHSARTEYFFADGAWHDEQRGQTWLGDGHILQNSTAPHGVFPADPDEVGRTDTTGKEEYSQLIPGERYDVWDNWNEGSSGFEATNRHYCILMITDNILRAYAEWSDGLRIITNAANDVSTEK